jgi:hypothetical protein
MVIVLSATFNNISAIWGRSVLLVEANEKKANTFGGVKPLDEFLSSAFDK